MPLAGSLIPWIDADLGNGQSKEEWKAGVETNKILGTSGEEPAIIMDGLCVRIGAMRSHSQALTLKLREDLPWPRSRSSWTRTTSGPSVVPNTKEASMASSPPWRPPAPWTSRWAASASWRWAREYISAFTVGDQLLWGAAEPLRRMLRIATGNL